MLFVEVLFKVAFNMRSRGYRPRLAPRTPLGPLRPPDLSGTPTPVPPSTIGPSVLSPVKGVYLSPHHPPWQKASGRFFLQAGPPPPGPNT